MLLGIVDSFELDFSPFLQQRAPKSSWDENSYFDFQVKPREEPDKVLRKALFKAGKVCSSRLSHAIKESKSRVQQCWPTRDRRAFASSAAGFPIVLYQKQLHQKKEQKIRVDIYLDVSGSMFGYLEDIISAILSCQNFIHTHIWSFSTDVQELSIEDLQSGSIPTKIGNHNDEVMQHIINSNHDSVVMITDGYFDPVSQYHAMLLKKANVCVVYPPSHDPEPLDKICMKSYVLPEIKENERTCF